VPDDPFERNPPHGLNRAAEHDRFGRLSKQLGLDGPVVRGAVGAP
jgi:hypothetical protein